MIADPGRDGYGVAQFHQGGAAGAVQGLLEGDSFPVARQGRFFQGGTEEGCQEE